MKSLPEVLNSCYLACPKSPRWLSIISSQWTELVSSNCILYSRSVDNGSSEHICNISICEITSDIKLINALNSKTSLQMLFENIQNVQCVLQFSSKVFLRTVASFFLLRGLTSRVSFHSKTCTNILEDMTKNKVSRGKITSLKLSIALKLGSKQTNLYKGRHL